MGAKPSVDEITKLELVVMPSAADQRYRLFESEEFPEIVELINRSHGIYTRFPIAGSGTSHALYITLTDGTRHRVVNGSNAYLTIDGDTYYYPDYERVQAWIEENELDRGNAKVPAGFVY